MSVVATIRSDFYGECAQNPRLAEALSLLAEDLLAPMSERIEIVEAIARPAEALGVSVDPGLPELIVSDLGSDRVNLAL